MTKPTLELVKDDGFQETKEKVRKKVNAIYLDVKEDIELPIKKELSEKSKVKLWECVCKILIDEVKSEKEFIGES